MYTLEFYCCTQRVALFFAPCLRFWSDHTAKIAIGMMNNAATTPPAVLAFLFEALPLALSSGRILSLTFNSDAFLDSDMLRGAEVGIAGPSPSCVLAVGISSVTSRPLDAVDNKDKDCGRCRKDRRRLSHGGWQGGESGTPPAEAPSSKSMLIMT